MTNPPPPIHEETIDLRGGPARVHVGGSGPALLLIHGGWGGAAMHWQRVWEPLAQHHRVIAPDLPGLGWTGVPPLKSIAAYARWLVQLLDALKVERAWCVGNSFGASVAWSLAGRAPERCAGLVLVDGFPMPATPPALSWLGGTRLGKRLMCALLRRSSYDRRAIPRAFATPSRAPSDLLAAVAWSTIVPRFAELLIAGDGSPAPSEPPLLFWGAEDRLPGTGPGNARKLAARLGSKLVLFEHAGHFPQLEAPDAFVREIERATGVPSRVEPHEPV